MPIMTAARPNRHERSHRSTSNAAIGGSHPDTQMRTKRYPAIGTDNAKQINMNRIGADNVRSKSARPPASAVGHSQKRLPPSTDHGSTNNFVNTGARNGMVGG